jgi:hypothetical protein
MKRRSRVGDRFSKRCFGVSLRGVYPPIPDIEKVKVIEMEDFDTNGFAEKRKEYQKIFLR